MDPTLLRSLVDSGYIPVVATVATDEGGQALNVNADTAAGEIAAALRAEKLILMTDVPGRCQHQICGAQHQDVPGADPGGHHRRGHDPQGAMLQGGAARGCSSLGRKKSHALAAPGYGGMLFSYCALAPWPCPLANRSSAACGASARA